MREVFEIIGCAVTGGNIYAAVGAGVIAYASVKLWDIVAGIIKYCNSKGVGKKYEKGRGTSSGAVGCLGFFLLVTLSLLLRSSAIQYGVIVSVLVLFAMGLLCLAIVPTAIGIVIKEIGTALGWEEYSDRCIKEADKGKNSSTSSTGKFTEQSRCRPKPQTKMCPYGKAYVCKKETPCSGSCLPKSGY